MAITTNNPPARCLDLTRSISRVGRGPLTGIDRVELEYLNQLLTEDAPLFGLVRIAPGFALLDQTAMQQFAERFGGKTNWGPMDAIALFHRKIPEAQRCALADVRRLSLARGRRSAFGNTLLKLLPGGTHYLNVGHSNLTEDLFAALRYVPNIQITTLIHDTIPLDFPHFQRAGTVQSFEAKLQLARQNADRIICISEATATNVHRHMSDWGQVPEIVIAPLGVRVASPRYADLPDGIDQNRPYFVVLGTIEPRKNHTLLLDLWACHSNSDEHPHLYVVGQRGWNNRAVFDKLEGSPQNVTELNAVSDGAVSALLTGAKALLFPSFAEGFGLPIAEAMALNIPVICNDLPVFHELFGNYPVYADATDMYSWIQAINKCVESDEVPPTQRRLSTAGAGPLTWENHFNTVLKRT